jgi:hypothetical protein
VTRAIEGPNQSSAPHAGAARRVPADRERPDIGPGVVLHALRKLAFRGEDTTRASIAEELHVPLGTVTEQLRRASNRGLICATRGPAGMDWTLTEAGEQALSAHLVQQRHAQGRSQT